MHLPLSPALLPRLAAREQAPSVSNPWSDLSSPGAWRSRRRGSCLTAAASEKYSGRGGGGEVLCRWPALGVGRSSCLAISAGGR